MYDGTDEQCTICLQNLSRGQPVYRVVCNHLFQEKSWDNYLHGTLEPECLNCGNLQLPNLSSDTLEHLEPMNRTSRSLVY